MDPWSDASQSLEVRLTLKGTGNTPQSIEPGTPRSIEVDPAEFDLVEANARLQKVRNYVGPSGGRG
jgi:hypothetical protein